MKIIMSLISVIFLCSCSSYKLGRNVIPVEGRTIQDIYKDSSDSHRYRNIKEEINYSPEEHESMEKYFRSESMALNNNFKLAYNPEIYMFVFPHLSTKEGVPIPAYMTKFKMYSKDYWALPGERGQ